jgi:hypothetical protein
VLEAWLAQLEATELARGLRDSVWAYPLVNAAHVAGVALLVGSILPLDLRLLGAWKSTPLQPLWRVLTRCAAAGLALAAIFGALLFITRATEYAASPWFLSKMAVVAVAAANAVALRLATRSAFEDVRAKDSSAVPAGARLAALVSLAGWLAALTLGRLVGYF